MAHNDGITGFKHQEDTQRVNTTRHRESLGEPAMNQRDALLPNSPLPARQVPSLVMVPNVPKATELNA